ncbi:isocitrate lyase/phosphoenolpyruvate mutase family protein [Arthrobacter sp. YAF34]|uniref:isocitrate lyase/phosphoenolpyruvate mutase family protein n=1 Tax=Arthrobacter sp. YAF34 TaxID=3233083 RepID=UPI003F8D9B89
MRSHVWPTTALYADAGADGIFVPGLVDPEDIQTVTAGIGLPVNVLAQTTPVASAIAPPARHRKGPRAQPRISSR